MNSLLSSQSILVTRPKPQGELLCEKIREQGGKAIHFPTIEITPISHQQFPDLHQFDWLIFTSPQAVYQTAASLDPQLPNVAAIGYGTAQLLKERHIEAIYPEDNWSSEGLLNLPEFQQCEGKKIAIVKGEGGRELLADVLTARGATLSNLIVYRRSLPLQPNLHILLEQKIDIIVCTSGDGLRNLITLWSDAKNHPVVVVSERMAEIAKQLQFKQVYVANNASHDEIIRGIIHARK